MAAIKTVEVYGTFCIISFAAKLTYHDIVPAGSMCISVSTNPTLHL